MIGLSQAHPRKPSMHATIAAHLCVPVSLAASRTYLSLSTATITAATMNATVSAHPPGPYLIFCPSHTRHTQHHTDLTYTLLYFFHTFLS
jgi:hypothetical protein